MVAEAATLFHQNNLQLTIATVPNAPGAAGETNYSAWIYENWRGAYDLAALAKSVDLICLMTYDQHTRLTPPGPVAGWSWTVNNLDYALKFVPREKISLGIPLYGYHWFAAAASATEREAHRPPESLRRLHFHRRRARSRPRLQRPHRMGRHRSQRVVLFLSRRRTRMDFLHRRAELSANATN